MELTGDRINPDFHTLFKVAPDRDGKWNKHVTDIYSVPISGGLIRAKPTSLIQRPIKGANLSLIYERSYMLDYTTDSSIRNERDLIRRNIGVFDENERRLFFNIYRAVSNQYECVYYKRSINDMVNYSESDKYFYKNALLPDDESISYREYYYQTYIKRNIPPPILITVSIVLTYVHFENEKYMTREIHLALPISRGQKSYANEAQMTNYLREKMNIIFDKRDPDEIASSDLYNPASHSAIYFSPYNFKLHVEALSNPGRRILARNEINTIERHELFDIIDIKQEGKNTCFQQCLEYDGVMLAGSQLKKVRMLTRGCGSLVLPFEIIQKYTEITGINVIICDKYYQDVENETLYLEPYIVNGKVCVVGDNQGMPLCIYLSKEQDSSDMHARVIQVLSGIVIKIGIPDGKEDVNKSVIVSEKFFDASEISKKLYVFFDIEAVTDRYDDFKMKEYLIQFSFANMLTLDAKNNIVTEFKEEDHKLFLLAHYYYKHLDDLIIEGGTNQFGDIIEPVKLRSRFKEDQIKACETPEGRAEVLAGLAFKCKFVKGSVSIASLAERLNRGLNKVSIPVPSEISFIEDKDLVKNVYILNGFDCVDRFVLICNELILKGYSIEFVGYNNSSFDNYYIFRRISVLKGGDVKAPIMQNRLWIMHSHYMNTIDVFKLIAPMSLKDAGKEYNLKYRKNTVEGADKFLRIMEIYERLTQAGKDQYDFLKEIGCDNDYYVNFLNKLSKVEDQIKFMGESNAFLAYSIMDTASVSELFRTIAETESCTSFSFIKDSMTVGSSASKLHKKIANMFHSPNGNVNFKTYNKKSNLELFKINGVLMNSEQIIKFVKMAVIAGMSISNKGLYKDVYDFDQVSMYPYIALTGVYPEGYKVVKIAEKMKNGKVYPGIYLVSDICYGNAKDLKLKFIPYNQKRCIEIQKMFKYMNLYDPLDDSKYVERVRLKYNRLKRDPKKSFEEYLKGKIHDNCVDSGHEFNLRSPEEEKKLKFPRILCATDINQLIKYGIPHKLHGGIQYKRVIPGEKIFGAYFRPFIAIKSEQDVYKATKDPKYNPGLRNLAKLKQNVLTGKLIQTHRYDKQREIFNKQEEEALKKKYISYKIIRDDICGYSFVEGKTKPKHDDIIWSGITIIELYAQARRGIIDLFIQKMPTCNVETDGCTVLRSDYEKYKDYLSNSKIKSIDGEVIPAIYVNGCTKAKQYGQFEIAYKFDELCVIGKKFYGATIGNVFKPVSKGIPPNAKVLNSNINDSNREAFNDFMTAYDMDSENIAVQKKLAQKYIYGPSINTMENFKEILNGKELLCVINNISKAMNKEKNHFVIRNTYMIKKCKIPE